MATTKKKTEPKKDYVVGRGKPPLNRRFGQPEGNIPNNRGRWKPEDSISYQYLTNGQSITQMISELWLKK